MMKSWGLPLNSLLLLLGFKRTLSSITTDGKTKVEESIGGTIRDEYPPGGRGCVLGACFLDPNPADEYRLPPAKELACRDLRDDCQNRTDECNLVGQLIWAECPRTCQTCNDRRVRSIVITAGDSSSQDEPKKLLKPVPIRRDRFVDGVNSEYGVLQQVIATTNEDGLTDFQSLRKVVEHARKVRRFMEALTTSVASACRNEHNSCTFWAVAGECENNPNYMLASCGPACFSCD